MKALPMSIVCFVSVASFLVPQRVAVAGPVTWEFSGEVTFFRDLQGLLGDSVTVGTTFSGMFTFESTTPDREPDDPVLGLYEGALTALSGTVGDVPFTSSGLIDIAIENDFSPTNPEDVFIFAGSAILLDLTLATGFGLFDGNATIFSSDALPLLPPPLEGLRSHSFSLSSQEEGIIINGVVNHLVPEPGTLCLLALATMAALYRRRPLRGSSTRTTSRTSPVALLLLFAGFTWGSSTALAQEVCGCMDMVFLIDVTGSFTNEDRTNIRAQLRSLVTDTMLPTSAGDLRLGFITFGDDVKVRKHLTADVQDVLAELDDVLQGPPEIGGGTGSLPEPSDQAIREMLGGCSRCPAANVRFESVPFRGECIKHAILITDNLPSGCDSDFDCPGDKDVSFALAARGKSLLTAVV